MVSNPAAPAAPADARFFRDGLTGVRALAALWVALHHLNALVGPQVYAVDIAGFEVRLHPLLTVGWVGANMFFVLSGFLLTTHLLESQHARWPQPRFGAYFVARVRRVFPAYWAQLVILFAAVAAATRALPEWTDTIPLHIPMMHNLTERANWAINGVYWTLPIEFSFYLVLPFVARWLLAAEARGGAARWRTLVVVALGALAISWSYRYLVFAACKGEPVTRIVWIISQLPGTIDQFILGTVCAAAWRWSRQDGRAWAVAPRDATGSALCAASLLGLVAWMYFLDSIFAVFWTGHWAVYVWYSGAAACVALLLLSISMSGTLPRLLFENRVAVFLGTVSYSLYLWHFPIALALAQVVDVRALGLARFTLIALPLIVVASALSYYLIERPFLARRPAEPRLVPAR